MYTNVFTGNLKRGLSVYIILILPIFFLLLLLFIRPLALVTNISIIININIINKLSNPPHLLNINVEYRGSTDPLPHILHFIHPYST